MANIKFTIDKKIDTREELDAYVRSSFGENQEKNKGLTIEAHPDVLKNLALSEDATVYGVRIVKNDKLPKPDKKKEEVVEPPAK